MPFMCGKHELATLPWVEPLELWTDTKFFAASWNFGLWQGQKADRNVLPITEHLRS